MQWEIGAGPKRKAKEEKGIMGKREEELGGGGCTWSKGRRLSPHLSWGGIIAFSYNLLRHLTQKFMIVSLYGHKSESTESILY